MINFIKQNIYWSIIIGVAGAALAFLFPEPQHPRPGTPGAEVAVPAPTGSAYDRCVERGLRFLAQGSDAPGSFSLQDAAPPPATEAATRCQENTSSFPQG